MWMWRIFQVYSTKAPRLGGEECRRGGETIFLIRKFFRDEKKC